MNILVKLLDTQTHRLKQARQGDAGYDLRTTVDLVIRPGERAMAPTGIAIAMEEGTVGLVVPRSGLAMRSGISLVNTPGIIDAGYRGEIRLCVINHGQEDATLKRGERIGQIVFLTLPTVTLTEVPELPDSERGTDGFGSTGRN